jgi:hypothetical protein
MTMFRMTLWLFGLLFIATIYNVVSAYTAMGSMDVQEKFEEIGLLEDGKGLPYPPRKPLQISEMASN